MPLTEVDLILSTSVAAALFLDFLLVTMVIPILPALLPHDPLRAGLLFAAKPLCQMLFNPLFGASGLPHATMLRAGTLLGGACAFARTGLASLELTVYEDAHAVARGMAAALLRGEAS